MPTAVLYGLLSLEKRMWRLTRKERPADRPRVGDDVPADLLEAGSDVLDEPQCRVPHVRLIARLVLQEPIPVVVLLQLAQEFEQRRAEVGPFGGHQGPSI
jgi:7,8-dihydro-6-hydroxymethylpterin-pyrophosphokinase